MSGRQYIDSWHDLIWAKNDVHWPKSAPRALQIISLAGFTHDDQTLST